MVRDCKSSDGCQKFLLQQCSGGFTRFLYEDVGKLERADVLEGLSFTLPRAGDRFNRFDDIIEMDDEYAEMFWMLGFSGFAAKGSRLMYLEMWPHYMVVCLSPDGGVVKACLADFKLDRDIFNELTGKANPLKAQKAHLRRHVFKMRSVDQYNQACTEVGFGPDVHPDLRHVVDMRTKGNCTTNINEDMIGWAKNCKEYKCASRFRRPEVTFGRVLGSNLVNKRFGYTGVQADVALERQSAKLPVTAYQSVESEWSMPFKRIESTRPTPTNYSPSPAHINDYVADVHLYRDAKAWGSLDMVRGAYLGGLFDFSHLVFFEYHVPPPSTVKVYP